MENELKNPAADTLSAALVRHRIELSPDRVVALDRYAQQLWDWNGRLNLTRHTDYEKFVARDVVDSMQLALLLEQGEHVLDVGTGGGVPGAIVAIVRPDLKVSLCESIGKKAKAVEAIISEAEINATVYHARAEVLLETKRFDTLMIRAVAPLTKLLRWFKPHWAQIGRLLVVKGPHWLEERGESRHLGLLKGLELRKKAVYPLPETESESVILEIRKAE